MTKKLWDLNFASKENFHPLDLRQLFPIFEKIFHAAFEFRVKEVFKVHVYTKSFFCIREETDVKHRKHVFSFASARCSHHYNEFLFCIRSQLKSDSFGKFLRNWVFNEPGFVLDFAVSNCGF